MQCMGKQEKNCQRCPDHDEQGNDDIPVPVIKRQRRHHQGAGDDKTQRLEEDIGGENGDRHQDPGKTSGIQVFEEIFLGDPGALDQVKDTQDKKCDDTQAGEKAGCQGGQQAANEQFGFFDLIRDQNKSDDGKDDQYGGHDRIEVHSVFPGLQAGSFAGFCHASFSE